MTFVIPKDKYNRCFSIHRFYDDGLQAMVFVEAGKKASIRLPEGQYYCKIGIGTVWYGAKYRFGDAGAYFTDTDMSIQHYTRHKFTYDISYEEGLLLGFGQ